MACRPQFTLFIATNEDVVFSKIDYGVVRRCEVFRFPFTFKDKPNPDDLSEKLIDTSLKTEKIKLLPWRQQFMKILIRELVVERKSTIAPQAVLAAAQQAIDNSNPLKEWFDMYVEQTENPQNEYTPQGFHEAFIATGHDRGMTLRTFGSWMRFFNIKRRISDGYNMYTHVKVRTREEVNLANAVEAMEVSAE